MRKIISLLLATLTGTATAADAPLDLLGLQFGQTFFESECPASPSSLTRYQFYVRDYEAPAGCWKNADGEYGKGIDPRYARVRMIIKDYPPGLDPEWINVELVEHKVHGMVIGTLGEEWQARLLEVLTEKYGAPTTSTVEEMQNRMGAKFSGLNATWSFDNLNVEFSGIGSSFRSGLLIVRTPEGAKAALDREMERKAAEPKL